METYPLTASRKIMLLQYYNRLYQCALFQRIRCTDHLFAPLSYPFKSVRDICLRLVESTVVSALWMPFRNAASLSKSVFKLGLCYVDQIDGRSKRKGENWFWTSLCFLTALFLACLRHAEYRFTKGKGYFPVGVIGAFLSLMAGLQDS